MRRHLPVHPVRSGFTLVELMIALAIMAILAAMAWPALQEAVQKSRRADGMSALAEIMQLQERWRANWPGYRTSLASPEPAWPAVSRDRHYALSLIVDNATAGSAYTIRATVRGDSPQTADSRCQTLEVEVNGGNITYRSLAGGGAANAVPDPCWVR